MEYYQGKESKVIFVFLLSDLLHEELMMVNVFWTFTLQWSILLSFWHYQI